MYITQDYKCNIDIKSRTIMVLFRIGNLLYQRRNSIIKPLYYFYLIFYRIVVEWILGVELPLRTNIGKRLSIYHGVGMVLNPNAIIGNDVKLRSGVVIGNKGPNTGNPIIGDNVDIGANAVVIGAITIGRKVKIGAGTVVTKDVPDNVVVVSSPVRYL